jgi:hypothetical protein
VVYPVSKVNGEAVAVAGAPDRSQARLRWRQERVPPKLLPPSRKKIAIVGLSTQTNVRCEMTKLPLVFYENDLDISLSFV